MLNIPYSPWPSFTQEEADAVSTCLLSNKVNYWTGSKCREFETEFAKWVGVRHAVSLANGTLALDIALKVLNIGSGDDVIVTPRSFIASASCVVNAGANPVFADLDVNSQNISADTIRAALTPTTKAIVVVHLAGMPAEMDPIMALANEYGLYVIEDCAQAHGARYKGRSVGSIGHIGAWSFCQDKIMTTGGEGGMVTTNDFDLWNKMWSFKDHGKSYDAVYNQHHAPGFRWLHESIGTNWRMLEMQAVIGLIQLNRMTEWSQRRKDNAKRIHLACSQYEFLRVPDVPDYIEHANYKCYVFVKPELLPPLWSRDRIVTEISAAGVPCYQGSCSEIYLEKAFRNTRWRPKERLPIAKLLGETSLMFLVHPTLSDSEIDTMCSGIKSVFESVRA